MSWISRRMFLLGLAAGLPVTAGLAAAQKEKDKKKAKPPHPSLDKHIAQHVQTISKKGKFPIKTFDGLAKALGGKNATIKLGDRTMKVADLHKHVPASTFPIASVDDLHAKVSHLRARLPPGTPTGKKVKVPKGKKPPTAKRPAKPRKQGTHGAGHGVKKS
jgi:hypothetical protein